VYIYIPGKLFKGKFKINGHYYNLGLREEMLKVLERNFEKSSVILDKKFSYP